jgi:hypothetical protein
MALKIGDFAALEAYDRLITKSHELVNMEAFSPSHAPLLFEALSSIGRIR